VVLIVVVGEVVESEAVAGAGVGVCAGFVGSGAAFVSAATTGAVEVAVSSSFCSSFLLLRLVSNPDLVSLAGAVRAADVDIVGGAERAADGDSSCDGGVGSAAAADFSAGAVMTDVNSVSLGADTKAVVFASAKDSSLKH